jgi:hypothetical protein
VGGTVSRNDTGLPAQHPHSARDGCTVQVGQTVSGSDSQAMLEGRRSGDSPLTWVPARCQSIQCSSRGSRYGVAARSWPRARRSLTQGARFLEQDGDSPEGGAKPSNETEVCPRGAEADCLFGPLRLFGPWAFLCLGPRPCGV